MLAYNLAPGSTNYEPETDIQGLKRKLRANESTAKPVPSMFARQMQVYLPRSGSTAESYEGGIWGKRRFLTPREARSELPVDLNALRTVLSARKAVERILQGEEPRLLVVVGPCSIHDRQAALEYAARLARLSSSVSDVMILVMRANIDQPHTKIPWRGFLRDPFLSGATSLEDGVQVARGLLREIVQLGVPIATEVADPILHSYYDDLVTWAEAGEELSLSLTHRELVSGLPYPVGFRNGVDGSVNGALHAATIAGERHSCLSLGDDGRYFLLETAGNPHAHLVLRGGAQPNYDRESIARATAAVRRTECCDAIVVDCSHGNSGGDPARQSGVFDCCLRHLEQGNRSIRGVMLESNLEWGAQPFTARNALRHGVSITDPCIDWETTESVLLEGASRLRQLPQYVIPREARNLDCAFQES